MLSTQCNLRDCLPQIGRFRSLASVRLTRKPLRPISFCSLFSTIRSHVDEIAAGGDFGRRMSFAVMLRPLEHLLIDGSASLNAIDRAFERADRVASGPLSRLTSPTSAPSLRLDAFTIAVQMVGAASFPVVLANGVFDDRFVQPILEAFPGSPRGNFCRVSGLEAGIRERPRHGAIHALIVPGLSESSYLRVPATAP